MSNRSLARSSIAALALAVLGATAAQAGEPVAVHNVKTVGALSLETQGLATGPAEVRRQGGFASAGAARWISAPIVTAKVGAAAY